MILVTGADGIVGRAVCNALSGLGKPFLPLVRRKRPWTPPGAHAVDLASGMALDALLGRGIEAVVHLAAAVPHSAHHPDTDASADSTRRMDRNVRRFQLQTEVPVVYMSTCGLYDRALRAEKREEDASQIRVESPYFAAKLDGERLFSEPPRAAILRLAAPAGPGQKPGVVLSRFIMAAREGRPIQIWGSGSREQNFVDVRDVADLILKALADSRPGTVNVAAPAPVTMRELAGIVIGSVGAGSIEFAGKADPREGETARYSISKARELFGWTPRYDLPASCRLLAGEDFAGNA